MSKHTPGPWEWSDKYTTGNNERTWTLLGYKGYGILSCDGLGNSPQEIGDAGRANAALIAAAPELLEALEQAQILLERLGLQSSDEYQANAAAIAKAKGEK